MRGANQRLVNFSLVLSLLVFGAQLFAKPTFKWGFQERLRHTYMNNNMDFKATDENNVLATDDEQGFFRVRTGLWGDVAFNPNFSVRARVSNEFRYYTITRAKDEAGEFTLDEIFFENLYLQYTTGGADALSLTVGRQNLMYGEGFVLMDGGPWDGSRAIYHDAIKISKKLGTTTFDVLGIVNTKYEAHLPSFKFWDDDKQYKGLSKDANGNKWMNDGQEEALGVYIKNAPAAGKSYEGYFFIKNEYPDPWVNKGASAEQLDKLELLTLGSRIVYPLTSALSATGEFAYQSGSQAGNKQNSYGGYANLDYKLLPKNNGVGTIGVYMLSGDDPNTPDIEGWNPLFSRWPKWSELYIYSIIGPEKIGGAGKVAYMTNTISPNAKFVMDIGKLMNVTLWVHNLSSIYAPSPALGTNRGNEFQLWLKFKFNKMLTGHFLYDYFIPGDFYPEPRANASFIRFELMYTL